MRAGITRIDSDRHLEIQIAKYVGHPGYKSPRVYYDLALAKLAQKITFNQRIQAICLPTEPVGENELVTVQGWGQSSEGYKGALTEINVAERSVHLFHHYLLTHFYPLFTTGPIPFVTSSMENLI